MRSYLQPAAYPFSKAAFHMEWSSAFWILRKLHPRTCSGTASSAGRSRTHKQKWPSRQLVSGKHKPMAVTTMVKKTANGWPDHWLSLLQMVADLNVTDIFPENRRGAHLGSTHLGSPFSPPSPSHSHASPGTLEASDHFIASRGKTLLGFAELSLLSLTSLFLLIPDFWIR